MRSKVLFDSRFFLFILYCAFVLSGFSALVYETVWVRYFRLFLGSASTGQVAVIVLWMGGLAMGSWLGSRLAVKSKNLLFVYAIAELGIGLFALFFHPLFGIFNQIRFFLLQSVTDLYFIYLIKIILVAGLVIFPMILVGLTFPVIASYVTLINPQKTNGRLSLLYFANSLGGALGAVLSGFVMIRVFGLPGSVIFAGIINICIGLVILLIHKKIAVGLLPDFTLQNVHTSSANKIRRFSFNSLLSPYSLLISEILNTRNIGYSLKKAGTSVSLVVFLVGLAVFAMEITWIRMFNLLLGSMFYTFEIVLSVLIFGIAAGSLVFARFADQIRDLKKTALILVCTMVIFGVSSLVLYSFGFEWLQILFPWLSASRHGFENFVGVSFCMAMVIIFPTAFLSGALFPVLMVHKFRKTNSRMVFGQLYSLNTLGGMAGAIAALFLFPLMGIVKVFISAIFLLLISGFIILAGLHKVRYTHWIIVLILFSVLMIFSARFKIDDQKLASGVFRYGLVDEHISTMFYKDGMTSSVALYETRSGRRVLSINGKPDASLGKGNRISGDETTQVLLAALPFSLGYSFKDVAVIGLGSGKTAHVVLGFPKVESLDIVEIEPSVIEAARYLGSDVGRIFSDRRSHLIVDDARSYFNSGNRKYDLIISEPSNPWVSGVGGLFSTGFYADASAKLKPNGLLVQWIHLYELDIELFASIIKAVSEQFRYFDLYFLDNSNLGLVASNQNLIPGFPENIFSESGVYPDLEKIGVRSIDDLKIRYIGSEKWLKPLFDSYDVPANSDFYPYLELNGPKVRFYRKNVFEFSELSQFYIPINEIFENVGYNDSVFDPGENYLFDFPERKQQAEVIYQAVLGDQNLYDHKSNIHLTEKISLFESILKDANWDTINRISQDDFFKIEKAALYTLPYLSTQKASLIWEKIAMSGFYQKLDTTQRYRVNLYHAVAKKDYASLLYISSAMLDDRYITKTECYDYLPYYNAIALFKSGRTKEAVVVLKKFKPVEECFIYRILLSNFEDRQLNPDKYKLLDNE